MIDLLNKLITDGKLFKGYYTNNILSENIRSKRNVCRDVRGIYMMESIKYYLGTELVFMSGGVLSGVVYEDNSFYVMLNRGKINGSHNIQGIEKGDLPIMKHLRNISTDIDACNRLSDYDLKRIKEDSQFFMDLGAQSYVEDLDFEKVKHLLDLHYDLFGFIDNEMAINKKH